MLDIKFKLTESHTSARDWMAPAPLRQLFWNVTYACNHRCGICFTDSGAARADELTTAEAFALVEQAHRAGVRDVIVSGGEPFLRKDLLPILARMAELGLTARIASNGSLITPDLLGRLRRDTRVRSFQISLDTLDPALYGRLHGTGPEAHAAALRALALVRDHGFHATASTRLTPDTLDGIPALLERASAENWATFTVHCPLHTSRAEGAWPQDADVLSLLEPALGHFFGMARHWLVETYIPWAPYHEAMVRWSKRGRIVHVGCRAGRDRLAIHPSGAISPCVCLDVPAAHVGNVRRDSLAEVFASSPVCALFRHPEAHGICGDCANEPACGGGCRAAAFALAGRLDGPDESCPVRRRKAAAAGKTLRPSRCRNAMDKEGRP